MTATESLRAVNASAQATLQNGAVHEGQVYSLEQSTSFSAGGITILKKPADAGHSSFSILVGDGVDRLLIQDTPNSNEVVAPFDLQVAPSKATAANRESDASLGFPMEKQNIGVAVTKIAQTLYNKFSKQFPKDTKWHKPGDSQDITVLGVKVKYPFSADNCEVEVPEGIKSLERIRNMVTNFLNSESMGSVVSLSAK